MDGKAKLWDVVNHECLVTYSGHSSSLRDVSFAPDGCRFATWSYDKTVRVWDTETGVVIQTYVNNAVPYCLRFHPEEPNELIVGCLTKTITQYNTSSPKVIQNYEEHLGAVNSLCFVDNNTKFVSAGDDKKLYIWEFGIPVVLKAISEPSLDAI